MSFTNLDLTETLNPETYRVLIGHTYKFKKKSCFAFFTHVCICKRLGNGTYSKQKWKRLNMI